MFVADEDAFASAAHAVDIVVLFETLEACKDGGVFFWLGFFGAEGVVGEGVEADCFGLVAVEGVGEERRVGGLEGGGSYGGHFGGWRGVWGCVRGEDGVVGGEGARA